MQFKTLVNAVALALFAASAQAKIKAGTYTISQEGAYGALAATFNGKGYAVTVTPEKYGDKPQEWIVADYGDYKTQSISPVTYKDLQCAKGANNVVDVVPAGNYFWNITETSYGAKTYTIEDDSNYVFWDLYSVVDGEQVTLGFGTGNCEWIFTPVSY